MLTKSTTVLFADTALHAINELKAEVQSRIAEQIAAAKKVEETSEKELGPYAKKRLIAIADNEREALSEFGALLDGMTIQPMSAAPKAAPEQPKK